MKIFLLKAASKRLNLQDHFEETLQYGVSPGGENVRKEVAKFLTRQYQSPVDWYVNRKILAYLLRISLQM